MSVSNVIIKYCQVDGLAMGASLAVILQKIWMKSFEGKLKEERCSPEPGLKKDPKKNRPNS